MTKSTTTIIKELLVEVTINKNNKKILIEKINKLEIDLKTSKWKYKDVALSFINDVREDIKEWREINIDKIKNDEYIENYFITKLQININNSLILENEYNIILNEFLNKNKPNLKIIKNSTKKMYSHFIKINKKVDIKIIAQNLLIFTTFERKKPYSALYRLWLLFKDITELENEYRKINSLIFLNNKKIAEIKKYWLYILNKKSYNYHYIAFNKSGENYNVSENIVDTSKAKYRSGNPKFEYSNLLKNIK